MTAFHELQTSRLLLRQLREDDIYEYHETIASDGSVTRFLRLEPNQDISETLLELQEAQEKYAEGNFYCWAVEAQGVFVGVAELNILDEEQRCASLLLRFAEAHWNQGYATEAGRAVLAFGFAELELSRISAEVFQGNDAGQAVMEHLGMDALGASPRGFESLGRTFQVLLYEAVPGALAELTVHEYQTQAMKTLNPELSREEMLLNSVMGLCGESGEVIDLVKKHRFHGAALNREALILELGDVAWYLAEAASALEVPLETIFRSNLTKLRKRYPNGFIPKQQ